MLEDDDVGHERARELATHGNEEGKNASARVGQDGEKKDRYYPF